MQHPGPAAYGARRMVDQLVEGKGLRSDRVYDQVFRLVRRIDSQPGQVFDVDGLQQVFACAGYDEYGELAKHPGDVVQQDVAFAEYECGPDNGIGEPRLENRPLYLRLTVEVRVRRVKGTGW